MGEILLKGWNRLTFFVFVFPVGVLWGITLIGIGDTNCDPEELDFIIPGNDDAIRAVKLIVSKMADAVIEANQGEEVMTEEMAAAETEAEATDIEEVVAAQAE